MADRIGTVNRDSRNFVLAPTARVWFNTRHGHTSEKSQGLTNCIHSPHCMIESRERDIDGLRCVAVFMVVFLHAWGAASQYAVPDSWELRAWTFLAAHCTSAAMPSLFLISGYLLFRNFTLPSWPAKIVRRARRLIVPYVCWNIVFVLFYLSCGHVFTRVKARIVAFGLTTLHGCLSKVVDPFVDPIDFPVWYMRTIFVFAVLSPVLWLFLRHSIGRWVALAMAGAYFGLCENHLLSEVPAYPSYSLLAFVFGGLLAVLGKPIAGFFHSRWWILPGLLALGLHGCSLLGISPPLGFASRSLFLTPMFFCVFGRLAPSLQNILPPASTLFFIYTGHFLFCSVWVHALAPMMTSLETGKLTLLIFLFLVFGLAVLLSVYRLCKRLLPNFIRIFDGSL